MELLIGIIISALATAFALGLIELVLPANVYRYVKIIATYPMNLIAFWYLDFKGLSTFVGGAAASLLALVITLVVERMSTPRPTVVNRRNY